MLPKSPTTEVPAWLVASTPPSAQATREMQRLKLLKLLAVVTLLANVGGCSETTATEPGPLGTVDLRPHWSKAAPPVPSELETHTTTWKFCAAEPFPAAEATISWRSFREGDDGYVVDYDVKLTRSAPHLVVTLANVKPFHGSVNLEPGAAYLGVTEVHLKCTRKAYRGWKRYTADIGDSLQLVADGSIRE